MSDPKMRSFMATLGPNEGYVEEMHRLYTANRDAVPEYWRTAFDTLSLSGNGTGKPETAALARPSGPAGLQAGDQVQPLRGAAARIAANMEGSLTVPTATSQRAVPVAMLEETRKRLNRALAERGIKVSITHLLGWALVQAAREVPALNSAFVLNDGVPSRIERAHINLGLAVDVEAKGGVRTLLVPVVKAAENMTFPEFVGACDRLIQAARTGKSNPDDLQGATITLTNPGTLGTRASVPRLMPGQAAIVAVGAMAYPPGFEAVTEDKLQALGVAKTVTLSCTYDHRVVQGAESGQFLARVHQLLLGTDDYYEQITASFAGMPPAPAARSAVSPTLRPPAENGATPDQVVKQAAVYQLVHAYRVRGHLMANVDPMSFDPIHHPELEPDHFGLTTADLDREFLTLSIGDQHAGEEAPRPLRAILKDLQATYCGTLSCEYMHIQRLDERQWLQAAMEPSRNQAPLEAGLPARILEKLTQAEAFERLLHTRYVGHKRFSLEGGESLIPALDRLLNLAGADGVRYFMMGMAHRGRLNVLANAIGKSMGEIFSKFEDSDPESVEGSGDVKYHIGADGEYRTPTGQVLQVSLAPNPSHLEAVDPVLEGAARARQELLHDESGDLVLPVLMHGDAAFAGQGVVAETLNLSQLDGYYTGGTVHIVINNRIGFTTSPSEARSSLYCTDVARIVQAPIFHVNGDDPEAVLRSIDLAYRFRRSFHKDVVVDMVCYRRHGHNEGDDPSLTQPVLYRAIEKHPSVRTLYARRLEASGALAAGAGDVLFKQEFERLAASAESGFENGLGDHAELHDTPTPLASGVTAERLTAIGQSLAAVPAGFTVHPKLKAFLERRAQAVEQRKAIDWSLAEALAFGSLTTQGTPVRLVGQDTGRGTFSQRHAALYDYNNGAKYVALAHLAAAGTAAGAPFDLYDTLLSEEAVLGFEFGYSMTHPSALVLWEAQFGDFVNGAQVVIDQFLSASLTKWGRSSGLVLLLPHGYEGQGPEHSSARVERFLQLCAEENLQIANCTTAAQYFHLLRRQGLAAATATRRPLILFTPKSLLRHPEVPSPFEAFTAGSFQAVLSDAAIANPQRVIFCTGKIYYDLLKQRREMKDAATALVRVEQLYPFPAEALRGIAEQASKASEWLWVQEEPENMGAWRFVQPQLQEILGERRLRYVGRDASASPAAGSLRRHQNEQRAIVMEALTPSQVAAD